VTITRWSRADDWGVVDRPDEKAHGGRLYVAPLRSGEITVLEGAAAVVARAALAGVPLQGMRTYAADALAVAEDLVDVGVVEDVVTDLVRLGLLRSP
jgi:hypothetical protein